LVASLKDSDPEIRGEAVTSLGLTAQVTAQDRVTESLLPLLDDESVLIQRRVAAALGKTRSRKALTPLSSISFDRSRDRVLRITAIKSLARVGPDKEIVQRLQDLSKDESEHNEIQKIALDVLSGLEWLDDEAKKRQTGILIDEMRSGTHERRISTIKQLSKFSNREAINALMEAAGDESADVRKASAESLREINTPISIPVLIPLLDDPDKEVAEIAESACKNLLRGLLYNIKLDKEKREAAAAHLAKMGAVAVDPLLDMLRDVENIQSERATPIEIQKSVVNALSRMTDPSAVKILCRALEDANSDVVWGAAKALGNIGDASAIEALDKALRKYSQMLKKDLGLTYVSNVLKEARSKLKSRENEFKR
jgi:HEAT repeat protein